MSALRRRAVSVPALFIAATALTALAPVWLPIAALADVTRGRRRLPTVRLLAFGFCWAWLESAGVIVCGVLWVVGRRRHAASHLALQRWWAARLMGALRATTGLDVVTPGAAALSPGPAVILCRHASLADSLLSAWVITSLARLQPRYVLKRELLADPCLDIVGGRLPNHFLDREATDSTRELDALRDLASGLDEHQVAVIFPEGTRSSPAKRTRALEKIRERDPDRATRLSTLRHLLPPRPAGSEALVRGAPHADVVFAWHVGFDGLDTFGGILRALAAPMPTVVFDARRVPRSAVDAAVTSAGSFARWIDDEWRHVDDAVDHLLTSPSIGESR
ncbi:MAG: lysophospholipid acyltransferase family protein [Ilumatobacteraceae bacterium]